MKETVGENWLFVWQCTLVSQSIIPNFNLVDQTVHEIKIVWRRKQNVRSGEKQSVSRHISSSILPRSNVLNHILEDWGDIELWTHSLADWLSHWHTIWGTFRSSCNRNMWPSFWFVMVEEVAQRSMRNKHDYVMTESECKHRYCADSEVWVRTAHAHLRWCHLDARRVSSLISGLSERGSHVALT